MSFPHWQWVPEAAQRKLAPNFSRVFLRSALGVSQAGGEICARGRSTPRWCALMTFPAGDPIVSCLLRLWVYIVSVCMGADANFLCSRLFLCIWECCWEVSREKLGPCFQCIAELYQLLGTSRKHRQDSRHPQEANPIREHWCHWQTKHMRAGKTNCFATLLMFPQIRSSAQPLLCGPVWQIIYTVMLQQWFCYSCQSNSFDFIF